MILRAIISSRPCKQTVLQNSKKSFTSNSCSVTPSWRSPVETPPHHDGVPDERRRTCLPNQNLDAKIAMEAQLSSDTDTLICHRRRDFLALAGSFCAVQLAVVSSADEALASETPNSDMAVFTDRKNLFRLEYPVGWQQLSKAGATLLLRDPADKYSQIGVTVSPVKISSLTEFGTVHEIGERLLKAEAAKESTVPGGVTLISEAQRIGVRSGATFYDYEYRLITTHGNKRVFNSVAVHEGTLFIMNAQVLGDDEQEGVRTRADSYGRVARSFDVGLSAV